MEAPPLATTASSKDDQQQPLQVVQETTNDDDDDVDDYDVDDWKIQRDESKAAADAAFRLADYATAIHHYSAALSVDPDNATLLSNRSAAYLKTSQKSKALHDATACVEIGTMGVKGLSRLAAAQQSLGRYEHATVTWKRILQEDRTNPAAAKGIQDCTTAMAAAEKEMQVEPVEEAEEPEPPAEAEEVDELDDFFNDVEMAATEVVLEKQALVEQETNGVATNKIATHKKNLGTASEQMERLLQENYLWKNLNPFYVLDVEHTATKDDISRRYKALSLLVSTDLLFVVGGECCSTRTIDAGFDFLSLSHTLTHTHTKHALSLFYLQLHPDKNRDNDKAQDAYDQVLKAKAMLDDDDKINHVRALSEQGMKQGKVDWERRDASARHEARESFQFKAVQRIFAQVEYSRREVEKRERNHEKRERQQEDDEVQKERDARAFDKKWKGEERVEKRIGNWRDFAKKRKK
jgi:tetratricopeptide (TPR) repeat protein